MMVATGIDKGGHHQRFASLQGYLSETSMTSMMSDEGLALNILSWKSVPGLVSNSYDLSEDSIFIKQSNQEFERCAYKGSSVGNYCFLWMQLGLAKLLFIQANPRQKTTPHEI